MAGKRDPPPEYKLLGAKSILKFIIIFTTLLGFSCIVVSHRAFGDDYTRDYQSRYLLFLGSHLFGFLSNIVILAMFLTGLDQSCGSRGCWEMLNLMISFVLAILCGVASGLMIYYANMLYRNSLYKTNTEYWKWYTDHFLIAVFFGFINTILFLLDTALHSNAFFL